MAKDMMLVVGRSLIEMGLGERWWSERDLTEENVTTPRRRILKLLAYEKFKGSIPANMSWKQKVNNGVTNSQSVGGNQYDSPR